jgi:16S rRNA (uracil1498-N3)-methyltransferase
MRDNPSVHARFYAPDADAAGALVALPAEEAQHLTRVLRLRAGDVVAVFNGRGSEFQAVVEQVAGDRVDLRVGQPVAPAREARVAITLAQAVLKGDKMDEVVRDAVMIGVAAIQPLVTSRTEVSRSTLERGRRRQRWERIAVSSAKQCGRAVIPPVLDPLDLEALLPAIGRQLASPALMLVEPAAGTGAVTLAELDGRAPKEATIVIGPEGGWTPEEIGAADSACRLVTLGPRTLRADAVATIAIAALYAKWNEF